MCHGHLRFACMLSPKIDTTNYELDRVHLSPPSKETTGIELEQEGRRPIPKTGWLYAHARRQPG